MCSARTLVEAFIELVHLSTMSASLNPSSPTIAAIKSSIQNSLKSDLPPDMLPSVIAPLVSTVNQWSNQIPALLESVPSVNQVFEVRSLIFVAPRFTQNVFGIPFADLPLPYHEFMTFIHKLIDAQKVHKDKPIPRVRCVVYPGASYHDCILTISQGPKAPRSHNQVQALRGR